MLEFPGHTYNTHCNIESAVKIAHLLEKGLPDNLHIGLTGGVLYKDGPRKDIDFVVYSHRCFELIDTNWLAGLLLGLGLRNVTNFGRVIKGRFVIGSEIVDIDIIVPESATGEYVEGT